MLVSTQSLGICGADGYSESHGGNVYARKKVGVVYNGVNDYAAIELD